MSDIKTIDQLDETSAAELTDSDLLMTSVRNINGSYTSKKMTLNALADYVNSKSTGTSTPTKSYIGGPLIYDTDEEGVVLTTEQEVRAWEQSNTNYLWDLFVGKFVVYNNSQPQTTYNGAVKSFTKIVNKDCLVWIKYTGTNGYGYSSTNVSTVWHSGRQFYLKIDNKDINLWPFRSATGSDGYILFLAAGQKIEIGMTNPESTSSQSVVRILPIISGARFFIDTKTDKWDFGLDNDTTSTGGFTHEGRAIDHRIDERNYTFQYKASSPTRLIIQNNNNGSFLNVNYQHLGNESVWINGKKVLCDDTSGYYMAFNLRTDDELKITDDGGGIGGATAFCAYPIIMD